MPNIDSVLSFFPLRAASLADFVEIVKTEKCTEVVINPFVDVLNGSYFSGSSGTIGDPWFVLGCQLEFVSRLPSGRKLVCRECQFRQFGTTLGEEAAPERHKLDIRLRLIAEQKAGELRSRLPGIVVHELGRDNQPMSEADYE